MEFEARPRKAPHIAASALFCMATVIGSLVAADHIVTRVVRSLTALPKRPSHDELLAKKSKTMIPYDMSSCLRTQRNFTHMNNVMIFDGNSNTFLTYIGDPDYEGVRRYVPSYLIARSLRFNFPERFGPGAPSFQILFSSRDLPITDCLSEPRDCKTEAFAPILHFGSVPKDPSTTPWVIPMPLPNFAPCMIGEHCKVLAPMPKKPAWDDLIPQIIWRGSNYPFLAEFDLQLKSGTQLDMDPSRLSRQDVASLLGVNSESLSPRWRGVALSLQAKLDAARDGTLPWIDAMFVFGEQNRFSIHNERLDAHERAGDPVATTKYMGEDELVKYKYHIDFGGGGGTTWEGTIRKLAMPGLLFHHETLTKDWFHDELKPWVHYVPIRMDVSDLREKFEWAEKNPKQAERIAEAGMDFVRKMRSDEWMKDTYTRLFVDQLGDIVHAYEPSEGEDVDSILAGYEADGIAMHLYSTCGEESCKWSKGWGQPSREYSVHGDFQ